ncbi:ABC transporter permease [Candidatus Methanoperedens nitratireducens]|uniref:ABC-2 type transporter n=1 Tax=Candidatus Methanoperedens nitratireducens TaxID=1392998 RepID=A0A284VQT8_9EURY|nr:ABC transporter permease [Candidatus Methanoperedens nitroreducens]SNQ61654.1 ABC-2 type transporter [Candidatus Methanoperedens nitroreducens]
MGILTISRWELRRTSLSFSRKLIALSLLIIILTGFVSLYVSQNGFHINDGMYRVIVTDPALAEVLKTDYKFQVYIAQEEQANELYERGDFDVVVTGDKVRYHRSEKSRAALDALDKAVQKYDEARLLSYNDLNNTFPVWITVKNIEREQAFEPLSIQKLPEIGQASGATGSAVAIETPVSVNDKSQVPSAREVSKAKGILPVKEKTLATPSHFNPPVPFKSVVLSFVFIFPVFFIAQFFSASITQERVRRRGELLLASPVSPWQIVFGKLLPYLLLMLVLMGGITVYIGGSPWMLAILLPVALMFLSTAFLGAIISRSFKELTFILVFLSVTLSGYIFLPAMFTNIHAISIISPMTLVVRLLESEPVSISEYIFSTLPFYLVSLLILMFGIFIYREEDLFTQKPIKSKLLDSLQVFIERIPAPLFFLSIALIPLVYSAQLIFIVLMFNLPIRYGVVIFILLAAFMEELVKSVGIYAVFSRRMTGITTRNALKAGIYAGTGFFIGEKLILLAVITGIANSVFGSVMGIGLLIFPFLLHVTGTTVASLGMRYLGTGKYLVSLMLATAVHSAYNLYLIRGVLFG